MRWGVFRAAGIAVRTRRSGVLSKGKVSSYFLRITVANKISAPIHVVMSMPAIICHHGISVSETFGNAQLSNLNTWDIYT